MKSTYEKIEFESIDEVIEYIQNLNAPFTIRVESDENGKRTDAEFRLYKM